jgi:UDP-GlcNAc:undecaprenyl-phosphate/decaprenyl-phosphate GlcNAc-1-phosphate transferase
MISISLDTIWPVLMALLLAMAFVVALTGPARWLGCVDHPGGRKHHAVATPLVGGVAIFLSFLTVTMFQQKIPGESWSLLAAMSITVVFGLADDLRQVGYRTKFFGQLIAVLIVVSGTNVHVMQFGDLFGFGDLVLGKWSYLVTVISIIGLMNAINMIDGLDGLAGTQVLIPLVLFAVATMLSGDMPLGLEMLMLAGAVSGFLAFNLRTPWLRRARIFLGDVGGLLLGLMLTWYAVKVAGLTTSPLRPITAVFILAVPLLDIGSVMLLRILQGNSPFHADRQHMHHVLYDAGCKTGWVIAIMALLALAFGSLGLYADSLNIPEYLMFYGFLMLWAIYLGLLAKPQLIGRVIHRLRSQ